MSRSEINLSPDPAGQKDRAITQLAEGRPNFIVVPAYNEERVITSVLRSLIQLNHSIVVVDDGSTDRTWEQLRRLPVYALRHAINLGPGAALATGVKFALMQGAKTLVLFDADGQHQAEDIEVLLEPLRQQRVQVVFGCRFLRNSDQSLVPPVRRLFLRCATAVNGLLTGLWLKDAHNGLIALTREAAARIELRQSSFAYHSEIVSQVRKFGLTYVEVPTRIIYSDYSRTKGQPMWNAVNILIDFILARLFR